MIRYLSIALLATLSACSLTEVVTEREENLTPVMVVTANSHATEAGLAVLHAGGSAVDAAVAIEAVLSLVEPQSSGLAGGAFMVHFDAQSGMLSAYDGRETAPASASADLFLDDTGEALGFLDAKMSGRSTGVPGVVAMLAMAHAEHGRQDWQTLFSAASELAVQGFAISPRLHGFIEKYAPYMPRVLAQGPLDAYGYFYDDVGQALAVGHVLKNPDYAETLKLIAADPRGFYTGPIAQEIVSMVQRKPRAGSLTLEDLDSYRPIKHSALCVPYREMQVCGPPPPSSWLAVAMVMGLLDAGPGFTDGGVKDPQNWALFAQAQQLAYVDRDKYVADNDFVPVPVTGLLHPQYIAQRAAQISRDHIITDLTAGDPWKFASDLRHKQVGRDNTYNAPGTTHFVVVDSEGDVVSMTASVESVFGSTRMVGGMFLNNQLTDFAFKPLGVEGLKVANAVAPGKRPRSSMSPTIVLDSQGKFLMATGSPGGNNIIAYTAKSLIGVLDWGLTAQEAASLPNMVARGDVVRVENNTDSGELVAYLRNLGFEVDDSRGENSGLHIVVARPEGQLEGGVDPRREGRVGTH